MKRNIDRTRLIRFGLPSLAAVAACSVLALTEWKRSPWVRGKDASRIALGWSPFLRDVVEPIAIVRGFSTANSDDHRKVLTFRDARQVERTARYVIYAPEIQGEPEIRRILILDRRLPIGGPEERAFLGMLQRWYGQDAEAQDLRRRVERHDPSLGRTDLGWDGLNEAQVGKLAAMGMMLALENRE